MPVFNKNNTVAKPAPKAKAKSNSEVQMDDLEAFASIISLQKAMEGAAKTLESNIKGSALTSFVEQGCDAGKRPDNLTCTEGKARASVQLKVRSNRSPISQEDADRLEKAGVPTEVTDEVVETFILNPEYASNEAIMSKLEAALGKLGLPEDLFLHQSQKKIIATEDSLNAVFKLKTQQCRELLPLVSVMAIRPSTTASIKECFETVEDILEIK